MYSYRPGNGAVARRPVVLRRKQRHDPRQPAAGSQADVRFGMMTGESQLEQPVPSPARRKRPGRAGHAICGKYPGIGYDSVDAREAQCPSECPRTSAMTCWNC